MVEGSSLTSTRRNRKRNGISHSSIDDNGSKVWGKRDCVILAAGITMGIMLALWMNIISQNKQTMEQISSLYSGMTDTTAVIGRVVNNTGQNVLSQARISNNLSSLSSSSREIIDFEHQEGVVIATKIHGPRSGGELNQMLCLLQKAYNDRVNYNVVAFASEAIEEADIKKIEETVAPAKFTFVVDNPGLHERVASFSKEDQKYLLDRCNVTKISDLDWKTPCRERHTAIHLGYTWQCEFRSLHVWTRPELAEYKYMLWMDSDGFPTHVWDKDPVAEMIRRDMVIFIDNFPLGRSVPDMQQKVVAAFNDGKLCGLSVNEAGHFTRKIGVDCGNERIPLVHGFFHITNLDFYRSDPVMNWQRILIGNTKFSRLMDDQIAVTAPAAMLAPNRSFVMERVGIRLDVFHNGMLDGKRKIGGGYKVNFWYKNASVSFPEAFGVCPVVSGGR